MAFSQGNKVVPEHQLAANSYWAGGPMSANGVKLMFDAKELVRINPQYAPNMQEMEAGFKKNLNVSKGMIEHILKHLKSVGLKIV